MQGVVDLVCDGCAQAASRGHLLGLKQRILGLFDLSDIRTLLIVQARILYGCGSLPCQDLEHIHVGVNKRMLLRVPGCIEYAAKPLSHDRHKDRSTQAGLAKTRPASSHRQGRMH